MYLIIRKIAYKLILLNLFAEVIQLLRLLYNIL